VARLTVAADLAGVDRVRFFLKNALSRFDPPEEEFFKVELAVVEICVNIVRYAYPAAPGKITVAIRTKGRTATIEISDSGIPFDPRSVPKPDMNWILATGRTGGLGIYLARSLMDRFEYRREGGRNVLTLAKNL
jgi:serine/threonine-protein kinase RsbW